MGELTRTTTTRRGFLGAHVAAAAGLASSSLAADDQQPDPDGRLPLRIAGYPYDRVEALRDGRVGIERCRLTFEKGKISDLNQHVLSGPGTLDVTEIGLVPYLLAFCNDGFRDYQLLPVFPLKTFRHKSIFVHTDRGIKQPEDLRGRKVATVGYSSSSLTWIRGILEDEYGVTPEQIQWVVTSKDSGSGQTGATSKWEQVLPGHIDFTRAPAGMDESELLLAGEVDAVFHPTEPQAFIDRDPKVARLFPDLRQVEQAYFKKTGIFPIMHLVAIRRKLAEEHPWLPRAIFEAYCQAKRLDYQESRKIRWAYSSLPWYGQEFDETVQLMGPNFYSYGIERNRRALEAALRYLHEQSLATRRLTVAELFHESTLDLVDDST